ncbi:MAG: hypothetical protein A2W00_05825 [Candidatus Eisenbacteria bacterium RBG_16_71_46]|nr:MAG: hypothetical protein A2W00_05825 [Candidatus Eisenbacteria bacterium RBG_16_71_46]
MQPHRLMRIGAVGLVVVSGCAATPRLMRTAGSPLADHPNVVMVPLANLSGRIGQAEVISRIFFTELVRTGTCEVVDYGEAEKLIEELRLRDTGSLTAEQLKTIGEKTGARYALVGTILDAGMISTPDGQVPSVGVAIRLVDVATARVVWADGGFRTGEDGETVFGWGRQLDLNRVAETLATRIFEGFRRLAIAPASHAGGSQ